MPIVCTLVMFSLLVLCAHAGDWSYADQPIWPSMSPSCSGIEQSPINIQRSKVVINESLSIELLNYDRAYNGYQIVNNGHSVQFDYDGDKATQPAITGTSLNDEKYYLAQFHFHWGSRKGEGSEHTIDGQAYSLETHFVHYNSRYKSLADALGKPDGVTVLGVLYQIDRESNPKLDDVVLLVLNSDKISEANYPLRLKDLLPSNLNNFYRYPGSLTTPPCTEKITWLVLDTPAFIGLDQIEIYRSVRNEKERTRIVDNFRLEQNIRKRVVEASFDAYSSASFLTLSTSLGIVVTLVLSTFRL